MRLLLEHKADVNAKNDGRTALYIAVDKKTAPGGRGGAGGRGAGAAPGAAGGRGGGPAVSSMDIINALLAAGVDPNPQLSMRRPSNQGGRFSDPLLSTGTTPLLRAIVNNDTEAARVLLEKGANPNIVGMGTTPFLLAAGVNPVAATLLAILAGAGAGLATAGIHLALRLNTLLCGILVLTMLFTGILVNVGSSKERVVARTATDPLAISPA